MDRRGRIALAAAALLLLLSGCFSGRARTGLLHRWTDAEPVAARMYFDGADGTERTQPLPPQQLAELVDMLENMKYRTHAFHTDYFWYRRCGLEIELSDEDSAIHFPPQLHILQEVTEDESYRNASLASLPAENATSPL